MGLVLVPVGSGLGGAVGWVLLAASGVVGAAALAELVGGGNKRLISEIEVGVGFETKGGCWVRGVGCCWWVCCEAATSLGTDVGAGFVWMSLVC